MKKTEKPKKTLILFILFFTAVSLLIVTSVRAEDITITDIYVPEEIWLGEQVTITVKCEGGTKVWMEVKEPYVHKSKEFITTNGLFEIVYSPDTSLSWALTVPSQPVKFYFTVNCTDEHGNKTGTDLLEFSVVQLSVNIDLPSEIYTDEKFNIQVDVKKSGSNLGGDVGFNTDNFTVLFGSNPIPLADNPMYLETWIIKVNAADIDIGTYTTMVKVNYHGQIESDYKNNIKVKYPVEFELMDIDETEVLPEDDITITLKAMERGGPISLEDLQLKFQISDEQCTILSTTQIGNNLDVVISAPSLSPGSYSMLIEITYTDSDNNDYRWECDSVTIDYGVPITVNIKDSSDKAVAAQFRFLMDGVEKKKFITGSDGSFSGYIPPGTYDIELTFPNSKLTLYDVIINSFDDPIRFDHPSADADIPGIKIADVFVYEVALSYSEVQLEMKYDDSKVFDETKIDVYECDNWNFGRKTCNIEWRRVHAEIDTIRNSIKVNTTELSAFVIGSKKDLYVDFALDKSIYNLKDIIKIKGLTKDEDGSAIADVDINVTIQDTETSVSTKSDGSGVFSLEFLSPNEEGDYKLILNAEKPPLAPFEKTVDLDVVRSKGLSILMADNVRLEQGANKSIEVSIINSGQTDFSDLIISLSNIPSDYYNLPTSMELPADEEKKIWISFTIPASAAKTTYSGKIKVASDGVTEDRSFALTILPANKNQTDESKESGAWFPVINFPTANIVLPTFGIEAVYISLFGIASFSFAYWTKKRKLRKKTVERSDIKNFLLNIKREVNRIPTKIAEDENTTSEPPEDKKAYRNKKPSEDNTKFKELFNLLDKIGL